MDSPTSPQFLGALRVLLTAAIVAGLGHAAKKGWIDAGEVAVIAGALCTVLLAGWSWMANSLVNRASSVADSGAKITVPHDASDGMKALAADPSVPNVKMAAAIQAGVAGGVQKP